MTRLTKATMLGPWRLKECIGRGGNGEVWRASDEHSTVAVKVLTATGRFALPRFRAEVAIMKQCAAISGILPILGHSTDAELDAPASRASGPEWFAMPLAVPATEALAQASSTEVVDAVHAWSRTLAALHHQEISHRDIKPANLFRLNNEWMVGDFGLVTFPTAARVTRTRERIGPWTIMPPEMRRNAKSADGKAADVYLLAKTLWMLLAGEKAGFDGPFTLGDPSLSLEARCGKEAFVHPLEELIGASTRNNPYERPSMQQFSEVLEKWKSASSDFHLRASEDWRRVILSVLGTHPPRRAIWEGPEEVLSVLRTAAMYTNTNHLFYPSGGGNDLEAVDSSAEADCIELHAGGVSVVRPIRLVLELFPEHPEWNYLRLETGELKPSSACNHDDDADGDTPSRPPKEPRRAARAQLCEEVTELEPGQYVEASVWDDGFYGEDDYGEPCDLPSTARLISRYFSGAFVIFGKRSPYNLSSRTYDARHNRMTTDAFRRHIEEVIAKLDKDQVSTAVEPVALPRVYPPPEGAPKRFETILGHVVELARKRRREEERDTESHVFYQSSLEVPLRQGRHEVALRDYLTALGNEDIRKLEVLMYSGRDGDDFLTTHESLPRDSTEVIRQVVLDKTSLDSYLERGARMAQAAEFDIEKSLGEFRSK